MNLPLRCLTVLIALVALTALLGGCGGFTEIDDGDYYTYPRTLWLTLVWKVIDADGNPIGGVTMDVDGDTSAYYSDPEFTVLDRNYPWEWRGWLANWISTDEYEVDLAHRDDVQTITLTATKPGWTSASGDISFDRTDADYTYVRGTFMLSPADAAAPATTMPLYVEKIGKGAGH